MKQALLILAALAAVSCQSHPTGSTGHNHESVPMGSGRTETLVPERP